MHVPVSRLEQIRDSLLEEKVKLQGTNYYSVSLLQNFKIRFSSLFQDVMEKQLILKNVMTSKSGLRLETRYNTILHQTISIQN